VAELVKGNGKKAKLLGVPFGTASARLRKTIIYNLAKKCGMLKCYHCGKLISEIGEFSIEHKKSWQLSVTPIDDFYSFDNIAFSHLKCNCKNSLRHNKGKGKHPSYYAYNQGCRCEGCKKLRRKRYEAIKK
jgi:hypothetical protein